MELQIKYEFDPIFETMSLLYGSVQKREKETVIQQLCELGVDGEKFYKKYFRLIERYVQSFKKYMVKKEHMDFFFRHEEESFFLLMAVILVEKREWLDSFEQVTDEELRSLAGFILQDDEASASVLEQGVGPKLNNEKEVIGFLAGLDEEDHTKWHLVQFMERPKYWLSMLMEMVTANIPAFEKAMLDLQKPLAPFLESYRHYEDQQFNQFTEVCAPGAKIYPSFAAGVSQVICYSYAYQGIFMEFLLKKGGSADQRKEMLITRTKALSDKSKLEILCQLKKSSKYNLELAEVMNLSASTMSHHMNVLFACGFVGVEKKDGRVYYVLQKQAVEEYVEDIRLLLL